MTAKIGAKIVNLTFCPIVLSTFNTKKVPIKTYLREKVGFLHSFNENIYYFCKQKAVFRSAAGLRTHCPAWDFERR